MSRGRTKQVAMTEAETSPQSSPPQERPPSSEDEAPRQKKRVRVSKREIPEYRWTEESEERLAERVKENPQLYDKRQKGWLNVASKNILWSRVGDQLEPPATGPQCKKHYENMRTRVGKIMKKEKKKIGSGRPQRSARDDHIMETWSFLTQYIVRGDTVPTEPVPVPDSAAVTVSDDTEELRSTGVHRQPSTATEKSRRNRTRPQTDPSSRTVETGVSRSDLSEAAKQAEASPAVCEFVKMSKGQTLRALVNERLAAAAEEIFVLFERTIAEYEEELCRCKEENQRKQQLLRDKQVEENNQIPFTGPDSGLNQEILESRLIKEEPEEQSIKQEEEQLPVPVPEFSVSLKTEESSLLQQTKTEAKEETEGDDISSETHFHFETEVNPELSPQTDNDDDWEQTFNFSAAQMETEAEGDDYNQVQIRDRSIELFQTVSAPETVHSGLMSAAEASERKKHQCPFCQKRFERKVKLDIHIRVHTGEKPYGCPVCGKTFTQKWHLNLHTKTHTGEKPYSCLDCNIHFAQLSELTRHQRIHTGEKPFSCSICNKTFVRKAHLEQHTKIHTGDNSSSSKSVEEPSKSLI